MTRPARSRQNTSSRVCRPGSRPTSPAVPHPARQSRDKPTQAQGKRGSAPAAFNFPNAFRRPMAAGFGLKGYRRGIWVSSVRGLRFGRFEHALQRRFGDLGEGRGDLGLLRRRHPFGLDRRDAGFADAAQKRLAEVAVLDGGRGVIMQAATYRLRMRPTSHHMRGALPYEFSTWVWKL